jgi:thiamine pyrophosphate-dependent acetolactate synthase large subunit-like protein
MAVGAALALHGTQRLAVAVLGDGDFLMGATALWTAARCRLPLLVVIANNCSFFNDELHQDAVAVRRSRPRSNRSVGTSISDPAPDLAMLARSQGVSGFGPVTHPAALAPELRRALSVADNGLPAVVDVRVERRYDGREDHR